MEWYLVNLLTALFAILPVYMALHRLTAHRPAFDALVYRWDLEVLAELVMDNPELLSQLKGVFIFVPLLYLLVGQLLLGGVLGALWSYERPSLRKFGGDAFGHLLGLLKVFGWVAIPYAVSAGLLALPVVVLSDSSFWVVILAALPGIALLLWSDAALDFARVETVTGDSPSSVRCALRGFHAVLQRPVATLGVHLGFGLLTLLPLALLLALPDSLDAGGTWAVALAFFLRQVVVLLRVGLRVASLSGHMVLLRSINPRPSVDEETPDSVSVTVPEKISAS